jgi:hypothetical protein
MPRYEGVGDGSTLLTHMMALELINPTAADRYKLGPVRSIRYHSIKVAATSTTETCSVDAHGIFHYIRQLAKPVYRQ